MLVEAVELAVVNSGVDVLVVDVAVDVLSNEMPSIIFLMLPRSGNLVGIICCLIIFNVTNQ